MEGQVDNDPHIWSKPYTWGICRPDLRDKVKKGDYVFFVFGSKAVLPQMIFAYIQVKEVISHSEAFFRAELNNKKMSNKKINGNIIVDYYGNYNELDSGYHEHNFNKIKSKYVIADMNNSRVLSRKEIIQKAPVFTFELNKIFKKSGFKPIDIISRAGIQNFSSDYVKRLINWINN